MEHFTSKKKLFKLGCNYLRVWNDLRCHIGNYEGKLDPTVFEKVLSSCTSESMQLRCCVRIFWGFWCLAKTKFPPVPDKKMWRLLVGILWYRPRRQHQSSVRHLRSSWWLFINICIWHMHVFFLHMISWYHDIIVIYPVRYLTSTSPTGPREVKSLHEAFKELKRCQNCHSSPRHINNTYLKYMGVLKMSDDSSPKGGWNLSKWFCRNLKGFTPMYVYIIHAYIHMCLQTYMYIYIIPDLVRERHRIKKNGYKWQIEFLFISIYFFLWSLSHHCGGADSPRKQLLHFQVLIHSNNIFMNAWHFKHLKFKSWFNKNTQACKTRIRFSLFRHCKQIWRPSAGRNGTKNYRTNKSQIGLS